MQIIIFYKRTNNLVRFFLFLLVFFSIHSTTSYAQVSCDDDCTDVWSTPYSLTIEAPGYPDCEVEVWYRIRRCNVTIGSVQVEILNWGPVSGDCDDFIKSFIPSWPNTTPPVTVNAPVLNAIYLDVIQATSEQFFINLYNGSSSSTQQTLQCPNFSSIGQIDFSIQNCLSSCVVQDRTTFKVTAIPQPCSTEECCIIERQHCFNTQTGEVEVQETITTTGNPPCQGPLPTCNIPPNHDLLHQTDCTPICD